MSIPRAGSRSSRALESDRTPSVSPQPGGFRARSPDGSGYRPPRPTSSSRRVRTPAGYTAVSSSGSLSSRPSRFAGGRSERQSSPAEGQPASKRRKKEIRYKGGQAEMSEIELDVLTYTGGIYRQDPDHAPEVFLRPDRDVYISSRNCSSVILQQANRKNFTLQQIVIEGKDDGYDYESCGTDIQEGALFVQMHSDFKYTREFKLHEYQEDEEDMSDDDFDDDGYYLHGTPRERIMKAKLAEPLDSKESLKAFEDYTHLEKQDSQTSRLVEPHAKFYLFRHARKCTIVFDPPLAGRFIQIKFFSQGDRVEIKRVAAFGYVGGRLFPALKPR